ncbi:hypothetical protein SK128_012426, partial [Halocaridina rubra]
MDLKSFIGKKGVFVELHLTYGVTYYKYDLLGTILEQKVELTPLSRRGAIKLMWQIVPSQDDRMLTGYYIYYKPAKENITYLAGRDACDDDWERKYVEIEKSQLWITRILKGLMPATRYAVYVETDTIVEADSGARSAISYTKTQLF